MATGFICSFKSFPAFAVPTISIQNYPLPDSFIFHLFLNQSCCSPAVPERWGLALPSPSVVGAVPDSLAPNPRTDLPGRGKIPEAWGMEGWDGGQRLAEPKGQYILVQGVPRALQQPVATHHRQENMSCLHPASLDSDPWTHLPAQSTLQALQALEWSWSLPWAMVRWACPYLESNERERVMYPP